MIKSQLVQEMIKTQDVVYGQWQDRDLRVCTDSRKAQADSAFICLRGEKFDAFQFAPEIIKKGCQLIVFERRADNLEQASLLSKEHSSVFFLAVESTLDFLQALAIRRREQWFSQDKKREIIGLTGSNGKTTTKEMLRLLLLNFMGEKLSCTQGNFNNHIGVPLTLLELEDHHETIIVEMGTNHHGEIARLCEIAAPTSGLITNIGTSHIEFLKTQQGIYKEKKALYDSIAENPSGRIFVANLDDEFLKNLAGQDRVISCGEKAENFQMLTDHDHLVFSISGEKWMIKNPGVYGKHNYQDLGLAICLSLALYPEKKQELFEMAQKLELPENNRSVWKKGRDCSLFLDAYNASPQSMRASLESFVTKVQSLSIELDDVLFVLGDMNELGDLSPEFHREVGAFLGSIGAEHAVFVGRFAQHYQEGFGGAGQIFANKDLAKDALSTQPKKYKAYFLKASRSLQLESMTDIFLK